VVAASAAASTWFAAVAVEWWQCCSLRQYRNNFELNGECRGDLRAEQTGCRVDGGGEFTVRRSHFPPFKLS